MLSLSLSLSSCLVFATLLTGTILASTTVSADDSVVDDVNITVPISCSMTGTGNTSHNADVSNGTYVENIGTTTFKVFCNDNEGFALYANGYTNQEDGNNVLINSALSNNNTIATGTATSGDTSNWAMKLIKTGDSGDTTTAPLTIDNSFGAYHAVPTAYTKVAHKDASTDMASTGGATLQSTYAAYINQTQSAGTYSGKVKYVLVHPSTAEAPVNADQVGVTYNGNGLTFASGGSKNRVVYGPSCTPMYIATTPEIAKSPNVQEDGTQNGGNAAGTDAYDTVTATGASKLKVVINYDLTADGNTWIGYVDEAVNSYDEASGEWQEIASSGTSGTDTIYVEGESITFNTYAESASEDYGFYAQVYPIYTTAQSGTEETSICSGLTNITGAYAETTTWKGKWYITSNNETTFLNDEAAVINYLEQNSALLGTNVNIYAYNPYVINYNGNSASAGTMTGFTTSMDTLSGTADLMAPNFKKTGYGFAGWSEDQSATVNSSSKIYGPNEKVTGTDLTFDSSTRETTLYAVWVPTSGNMQSFSCSSLGDNQITALTDTRDNNVYTVGKMQDGNCWMMENLRLDNTATISSTNTNSPINTFTVFSATSDSWCSSTAASCTDQSMLNTNNTNIGGTNVAGITLTVSPGVWNATDWNDNHYDEGNNDHSQWYGYGNYYNWYSATAGNGTRSVFSGNAAGDICPTGWTLPTGNTGGQFSNLDIVMGGTGSYQNDNEGEEIVSNRWRSYPNNFIYSGDWYDSSAGGRGNYGYYWSRSASGTPYACNLYFNSSVVNPGTVYYYKFYGSSVRCIAQ